MADLEKLKREAHEALEAYRRSVQRGLDDGDLSRSAHAAIDALAEAKGGHARNCHCCADGTECPSVKHSECFGKPHPYLDPRCSPSPLSERSATGCSPESGVVSAVMPHESGQPVSGGPLSASAREKVREALVALDSVQQGWQAKAIELLESALAEQEEPMPSEEEIVRTLRHDIQSTYKTPKGMNPSLLLSEDAFKELAEIILSHATGWRKEGR